MDSSLRKAKNILVKYNQEHLLQFYNSLNDSEKNILVNQILNIDFEKILDLYNNSKIYNKCSIGMISPLKHINKSNISKDEYNKYVSIGENFIQKSRFAVVTMAGGQGTRLGIKGPKGTFELDILPKKSLFEIICEKLKNANLKYNISIPWYIMTSTQNHEKTVNFFEERNYFNYGKNNVIFFKQSNLPLIDLDGKLILAEPYLINEGSNGNGDVFKAMKNNNIISDMKSKDIELVFFSGVDNVLLKPVDPLFIGLTLYNNKEIAAKTIFKENANSKDWVFARKNNKPGIINCSDFVEEITELKDENGNYLYRELNILEHLFTINAIEKVSTVELPYHLAFRKNPFVNYEGMKQVPESPNTYKFETFIFDAFNYFDDIQLLRVDDEEEFSPIKSFNGKYNPERAKIMYKKCYNV